MGQQQSYRFSIYRLICTLGVIGTLIFFIGTGARPTVFLQIPSLILVLGLCFFLLLGNFGLDFLLFIPAALKCLMFTPDRGNARFADIARFASRYVIGASVIGMLIGLIQMLVDMSDPNSIGHVMATALLTPLCGLIVSEIFLAFVYKSFSDSKNDSTAEPLPLQNTVIPLVVVGFTVTVFSIMTITLA